MYMQQQDTITTIEKTRFDRNIMEIPLPLCRHTHKGVNHTCMYMYSRPKCVLQYWYYTALTNLQVSDY